MLNSPLVRQAALALSVGVLLATAALGQNRGTILHSFGFHKGEGGENPYSNLIFDSAGNMYGTTVDGGYGDGVAFELSPKAGGGWSYRVICEFGSDQCPVGVAPFGGLVMDKAGNLYGTTDGGEEAGTGTVYELSPSSDGHWTSKLLYSFPAYPGDGTVPLAGVILDSAGNLYGTTSNGGTGDFGYGAGTVFELTPSADGQWTETVLYNFQGGDDGGGPGSELLLDAKGNLYGTTYGGGASQDGTIFELSPSGGGAWAEATLHSFSGLDGANPQAGLIFDSTRRLYGTTANGGKNTSCERGCGTVFTLSPSESGDWSLTTLHDFSGGSDGAGPYAGLSIDGTGTLYGTTVSGGKGCGTLFGLKQSGGKAFKTVSFDGKNGCAPYSGVTLDGAGNIFGTASEDGFYGYGVVFELFNGQK